MAFLKDRVLVKSSNAPVVDGTQVEIRLLDTNALLDTVTTTNGYFEWQVDGYPGPIYYQCNQSGATKTHSSLSVGPAGAFQLGEMQDQMNFFVGGIVRGLDNELAVTPQVSGLTVDVATGAMTSKGLIYRQYAVRPLTFVPAAPDNATTNDYGIYVEFSGRTSTLPGKTQLVVSNVAIGNEPPLPTGVWRVLLAKVRIAPGQTSLTGGDITIDAGYSDKHTHLPGDVTGLDSHIIELLRVALGDYATGVIAGFRNGFETTKVGSTLTVSTNTGGAILTRTDTAVMVDHAGAPVVTTIPVSGNAALKRIDTIVLEIAPATGYRLDTVPVVVRVAGAAAANPVAPALQQDAVKRQIPLADVLVTNTAIDTVTDRRSVVVSGGAAAAWADTNFSATGNLSGGTRTLGTAAASLPAGTWFIQSHLNLTMRNAINAGTTNYKLTGNGTPVTPNDSTRIFRAVGGVDREVVLSGRRLLTLNAPTTVNAVAQAVFDSGDPNDIRDGVVYWTANRIG
ncbi:MAG: hypothetical protein WBA46_13765 [Thermomicrobiales bacterium]